MMTSTIRDAEGALPVSEPVEPEVAEQLDEMRAQHVEQLPDALVEQFHTAVSRAGRARKTWRRQDPVDADKQVFYMR